ncbi:MAG: hypothetical protein ACRDX9_02680 [Acidimicrobiia bacterium]
MEITPRTFGDILGVGMTMLGRVWKRLFAPAFWAFVLLGALTIAAFAVTGADDFLQLILENPEVLDEMSDEELVEPTLALFQTLLIALILQLLATGFVNLTVHRIVASEIAGEPVGTAGATSRAFGRLPVLVGAGIMIFVLVSLGLVALVIPGLWLLGSFTMVSAVVSLENVGPTAALRRSFTLVRGRWWPTVGFLILVGLIGSIAAQLVQLVALPVLGAGGIGIGMGLGFVVLVVVQGMVVAAIAVMTTLWYIDLRARKEPLTTSSLL